MPSISDIFPDRWLHPQHLQGKRPRVFVDAVCVESLFNPRSKKNEQKLVVAFHGKSLRLILNVTQARSLATICKTDDYSLWRGHEVVLSSGKAPNGADTILISPVPDGAMSPGATVPIGAPVANKPTPTVTPEPEAQEDAPVADASIWDTATPSTKSPDDITPAQLLRLTVLMAQAYGTDWGRHEAECAQAASKGAVMQFSELKVKEATVLIGKLEAAPSMAQNGKVAVS
jgi:hypothetical protein